MQYILVTNNNICNHLQITYLNSTSLLLPIYYSYKRKKQRSAEALERMQIREYGRKINEETRAKRN